MRLEICTGKKTSLRLRFLEFLVKEVLKKLLFWLCWIGGLSQWGNAGKA